jgi:hypothetical protein
MGESRLDWIKAFVEMRDLFRIKHEDCSYGEGKEAR